MKSFNLSALKIDNQNIFQFANNLDRYLFSLEIADEVFCNYVAQKAYRSFYDEILSSFEEKFPNCLSERVKISSIRYDITRYLEDLKPDGKKITENTFRFKINGLVANFNYFIDVCCSILTSLGERINKEDYLLDGEYIAGICRDFGAKEMYIMRKRQQEGIIDSCAKYVTKYFFYLCVAEEIALIEGDNLDIKTIEDIAFARYYCELDTLSSVQNTVSFIDGFLKKIYSTYKEICRKHEISPREEDFFRGKYPICMCDIFKYRMPIKFYKNIYPTLSDEEKKELYTLSIDAYISGDGKALLEKYKGYEDNFGEEEIDYDDLRQVFYHFLAKSYYPPTFSFKCFFDDENNIIVKEEFFEDRKGRDFLDYKNVGELFDVYDYKKAFDSTPKQEDDVCDDEEYILVEKTEELFRCVKRLASLIEEYYDKPYIPTCDIARLSRAVLDIEKEIKDEAEKNDGKIPYSFFRRNKNALIRMEEENRIAFTNYKNKFSDGEVTFFDSTNKEDLGDDIDSSVAKVCESSIVFDDEIFDSSGNEVSMGMETKKTGMKKIINEKYLLDLKRIRAFVNNNSSNQELVLLIRDAEKVLDIATKGYAHDECLQSSFDWFEKIEPNVIDGIDYFIHLNKVPTSYKAS